MLKDAAVKMGIQEAATRLVNGGMTPLEVQENFTYHKKKGYIDVEKAVSKTYKQCGINGNPATVSYLKTYLAQIIKPKRA